MNLFYAKRLPKLADRNALIVAYTDHFFGADYVSDFALPRGFGVSAKCRFSSDHRLIGEADALWFHGPSVKELPVKKRGQKWILMSMESAENYPQLSGRAFLSQFDITVTYRLDSDVPSVYPSWRTYGNFRNQHHLKNRTLRAPQGLVYAPTAYIASHSVPIRDQSVQELMQHTKIDSLGQCLNNRSFDDFDSGKQSWSRNGFGDVGRILKNYKFYIAFENSHAIDYVTERFFMALAFGSVPIYFGAPNIDEFTPADDCFIDARRFNSAQDLAAYINFLNANDDAYEALYAWRTNTLHQRFHNLVDIGDIDPKYRMLVKLLHDCDHSCHCGGRLRF